MLGRFRKVQKELLPGYRSVGYLDIGVLVILDRGV